MKENHFWNTLMECLLLVMYQTGDIAFCKILPSTCMANVNTKVPKMSISWFGYNFNVTQIEWNDNFRTWAQFQKTQRTLAIPCLLCIWIKEIFYEVGTVRMEECIFYDFWKDCLFSLNCVSTVWNIAKIQFGICKEGIKRVLVVDTIIWFPFQSEIGILSLSAYFSFSKLENVLSCKSDHPLWPLS